MNDGTRDNERRADTAMAAVQDYSDRNYAADVEDKVSELYLDITDLISDLLHLGERYGFEPSDLLSKARASFEGDAEDGPPAHQLHEIATVDVLDFRRDRIG